MCCQCQKVDHYNIMLTMLQAVVGAIEVGVHHSIPSFSAHGCQGTQELASAIVHQVVKTTVLLHGIFHESFNLS